MSDDDRQLHLNFRMTYKTAPHIAKNPIPKQPCAQCGYMMDASTETMSPAAPAPGDVSICAACGHLGIFQADMMLRELTPNEALEIGLRPDIVEAQVVRAHSIGDKILERMNRNE